MSDRNLSLGFASNNLILYLKSASVGILSLLHRSTCMRNLTDWHAPHVQTVPSRNFVSCNRCKGGGSGVVPENTLDTSPPDEMANSNLRYRAKIRRRLAIRERIVSHRD
ncbi:hypothetical protein LshimejAT787_1900360 [Lyophyllum shimeji]|uniref:Uncharacterized protein n=1 Tax=Lyophyllum shimeji TaxID=47721 RepID=A0A9P3Q0L8_LYOSH|nr:hypothetical protein LshimejAT787_1900360 [Lyophyllum shimeji]